MLCFPLTSPKYESLGQHHSQSPLEPTCQRVLYLETIALGRGKPVETRFNSSTGSDTVSVVMVNNTYREPQRPNDLTKSCERAFATVLYLGGSIIIYHTIYDKRLLQHPRYLPNQMQQELKQGLSSIPIMSALTVPFFLAEVRGWSKLYDFPSQAPFSWWTLLQYPAFILFTDSGIYWIHRWEHHPRVYRWLHKPHHKWVVPTPFASYAFHPLDGWAQSLPYHVFPFIFPLQKVAYLGLFMFVTMWTVLIRELLLDLPMYCLFWGRANDTDDAEYLSWSKVINDASCHTMHHLYFNYNYGQYLTLWDRLGGTYRTPKGDNFMEKHQKSHQS